MSKNEYIVFRLTQQFVCLGDRPISRVPQSCFTMANLSPFQKGYGSLQLFSVYQEVPSRQESDFLLTGLRVDEAATMAPGIFKEKSATAPKEEISNSISFPLGWQIGKRFPVTSPKLIFHVLDQGNLDQESNPIDHKKFTTIVIAPEVVHLSRFANRYRFYIDSDFPSRANLCLHNGEVAAKLSQYALAHMWRMIATMLGSTGIDGLPTSSSKHPQNMMQFVMVPTIRSLLEERADAGDVQTCVAVSEILQLVQQDQTVRISGIEIELIREWYLSYIDLLRDMCLFSQATNLIRNCKDPFIGALHHQSTTYVMYLM